MHYVVLDEDNLEFISAETGRHLDEVKELYLVAEDYERVVVVDLELSKTDPDNAWHAIGVAKSLFTHGALPWTE